MEFFSDIFRSHQKLIITELVWTGVSNKYRKGQWFYIKILSSFIEFRG